VIEALSFLTVAGRGRAPTPAAVAWFPVAGAVVGLAVGGSWWAAGEIWSPGVAAVVAVAVDLALTGLLHVDGLADSADGLLPHLPQERRLEVMAEPTVGAFALSVVPVVLLLRWSALASLEPDALFVAGLWCASRTLMAVGLTVLPYVGGGLAAGFLPSEEEDQASATSRRATVAMGTAVSGGLLALVLLLVGVGWPGAFGFALAVVAGLAVLELARVRVGGCTGDVLGAAGVVAETVGLLVVAAW
jgi:adenosylcobinamide-GDP ribazoletransferase